MSDWLFKSPVVFFNESIEQKLNDTPTQPTTADSVLAGLGSLSKDASLSPSNHSFSKLRN